METPELIHGGFCGGAAGEYSPENLLLEKNGDNFIVEELLDLPDDEDEEGTVSDGGPLDAATTDSSAVTTAADNSSNSSDATCHHHLDGQFPGDISVPYEELAELEWLSNIVEEPFSSEEMEKMQLISGIKAHHNASTNDGPSQAQISTAHWPNPVPMFRPDLSVPAKARSKRPRAVPSIWTSSRIPTVPPPDTAGPATGVASSSAKSDFGPGQGSKRPKSTAKNKERFVATSAEGRRCLHCDTDKTPQWRTGPMGPKTLCNACGVRYKSGRLVPEYRPAASPTFVGTKHSNSHRKVMEMRRQKDSMTQAQHQVLHQNPDLMISYVFPNDNDYLIHQHIGPDCPKLI
ncbi:hypothetical protein DM860_007680 [Cuscuta australis]|uniref:GATA transcription factor n=1 Tax=Cuscuta australis TaxID=267555 RepID=A0A328E4H6_9ASTE|nr:hypothetical protein DM860_007680 [Cuscuta australis]